MPEPMEADLHGGAAGTELALALPVDPPAPAPDPNLALILARIAELEAQVAAKTAADAVVAATAGAAGAGPSNAPVLALPAPAAAAPSPVSATGAQQNQGIGDIPVPVVLEQAFGAAHMQDVMQRRAVQDAAIATAACAAAAQGGTDRSLAEAVAREWPSLKSAQQRALYLSLADWAGCMYSYSNQKLKEMECAELPPQLAHSWLYPIAAGAYEQARQIATDRAAARNQQVTDGTGAGPSSGVGTPQRAGAMGEVAEPGAGGTVPSAEYAVPEGFDARDMENVNIPKFSGTVGGNIQSAKTWFEVLMRYLALRGRNPIAHFLFYLSGIVLEWGSTFLAEQDAKTAAGTPPLTVAGLRNEFLSVFDNPLHSCPQEARRKLSRLKMGSSYITYLTQFRILMLQAGHMNEVDKIHYFQEGLTGHF
ncbi:hypothetical protein CHLRE_08g373344v5 [Chlamydomonas reinhardtii]|uniref:Retrotransposon gag domain-containing protein n=1 Tax=Chlamydomonas reinhardtii TaxID=3055 RepID=A0A2K3DHF1_CHLRE|nr:uncharacterized protein CHLRE_08g373344v5 [Chlamydomonas reinhardtii]PNW79949.1 hypothetical protein CHLRE_08g373344v5 [Chlamydomonas reinhardtii]